MVKNATIISLFPGCRVRGRGHQASSVSVRCHQVPVRASPCSSDAQIYTLLYFWPRKRESQGLWKYFFALYLLVSRKSCNFAESFLNAESPWVITGGDGHIHTKAFSERFGFDALRISQIQTSGQKPKQRERPLEV